MTPVPHELAAMLQQALAFHQRGQLTQAELLYRRVLQHAPNQFDALHLLGVVELQRQHFAEAAELIGQALILNSNDPSAHSNIGAALRGLKRPAEALASYDRALALRPDYAEALNNRANVLCDLGRAAESLDGYDRALALKPDYAEALFSRGDALLGLGRPDAAIASYDRALALRPDNAEVLNRRGNALHSIGRHDEALASFDRALALRPDAPGALNNRGNALLALRRPAEAIASYDRALALKPDYPDALSNHGAALRDLGHLEAAIVSFDRALAIDPAHADALNNRGGVLRDLERHDEAVADLSRLLAINPDFDYLKGGLFYAKNHCCDWTGYSDSLTQIVSDIENNRRSITPFALVATLDDPQLQLHCAKIFINDKYDVPTPSIWRHEIYDHDKIRIAYLSSDFYDHATAYLMVGLFETHDKSKIETTAISFNENNASELTERLKNAFTNFIDVRNVSDRDVATLLREMEIDIAIDLKGYTSGARSKIFSFRPAPIQVNYLGYPGTIGAEYIDYIIADRFLIPEDQHSFYTEKVVYLPDTYQPNDSGRRIAERTLTRGEAGLPERGFVFCSFNNNYKITPTIFEIWMRLLHRVEGSVLWLLGDNPAAIRNLRRNAEIQGIAPERLVFAPRITLEDHLARHRLADLMLDTLPYNAHTTASDALWAGLPLVTCPGTGFAGRVAGSLLMAAGLPELIVATLEDYEALALALTRDQGRLAAIKATLARNRNTCPLFDTDRYRRHIESAYHTMWQRYQRGEPPASFAVNPIR
jgi:protein O-GlcNAc transferase